MRSIARNSLKAGVMLALVSALAGAGVGAFADVPNYGTLAAAIRSANFPCHHVIRVTSTGSNAWDVQCNSGKFHVIRNDDDEYSATKAD